MKKKENATPIICLMGPTAVGKTPLAVEMVKRFPLEIVSVDSAMVYLHMDIGTAKPTAQVLNIAPHRLINLLDPKDAYSAGQFREDALREMDDIIVHGRIPLLVGGTMLYFRVLQQGLANLPRADINLRNELQMRAEKEGWEALHAFLASIDPKAAERIHVNDSQRIQRALEVYLLTNKPMSTWQAEDTHSLSGYHLHNLVINPADRKYLHERIAKRFLQMLDLGLIEEVRQLYERGDLTKELPSMRSVGYREVWDYLDGQLKYEEMCDKAIVSTRQLAKRQMTWLRSWPDTTCLDAQSKRMMDEAFKWIDEIVKHFRV